MKKIALVWTLIIASIIGIAAGTLALRKEPVTSVTQSPAVTQFTPKPTIEVKVEQISKPQTLTIPKINVEAKVEEVGEDKEGKMDVPKGVFNVGWYNLGYKPGERGSAVFAGHLDTVTGAPAVFYYIRNLSPGDEVIVTDQEGKKRVFEVTKVQSYPFNQVPLDLVFGPSDKPKLNLITCVGTWDVGTRNYSERLVVYTEQR